MFRKSPSNDAKQDDQIPIIINESLENDILNSEQHVSGTFLCAVCLYQVRVSVYDLMVSLLSFLIRIL